MASRAATCGRSRGKPGSFTAGESSTGEGETDTRAMLGADAALDPPPPTRRTLPLHPLQRGVYPAVEANVSRTWNRGRGTPRVRFTASESRRRLREHEYTFAGTRGNREKRFRENIFRNALVARESRR